eukprot:2075078-Pyramimonas_sp.AAC.1
MHGQGERHPHALREDPRAQVPETHRSSRRGGDLQGARGPGQQAGVVVAGGHLARARRDDGRTPDRNTDWGAQVEGREEEGGGPTLGRRA